MDKNTHYLDKCVRGLDNDQFQMEMDNVASVNDNFLTRFTQSPGHQTNLENVDDPPRSVLGLKYAEQPIDSLPLTESHACRYEECLKFHAGGKNDPENPSSHLKNVFFYLVLLLLLLWVFVYTALNKMNVL